MILHHLASGRADPPDHEADVPRMGERYGVVYEFDDGRTVTSEIGTRDQAEFEARDRIGDDIPVV